MTINLDNLFIGNPAYGDRYYSYDWEYLLGTYKSLVSKDLTVAEIGSSNFAKTKELARYCKRLIGIEIDRSLIFAPTGNVEIINADWQELSSVIPENSIDIAVSSHVIEHVPDDLRAINETYAVLKKRGSLLFSTPNRTRLTRRLFRLLGQEGRFLYKEHVREYAERDLYDLAAKSKFSSYSIKGVVLGLHAGNFMFYLKGCPRQCRHLANFWEVRMIK